MSLFGFFILVLVWLLLLFFFQQQLFLFLLLLFFHSFFLSFHQFLLLPLLFFYQFFHLFFGQSLFLLLIRLVVLYIAFRQFGNILFHCSNKRNIINDEIAIQIMVFAWIWGYNLNMSQAFKKKKQESSPSDLKDHLNFLLGSQLLQPNNQATVQLDRNLILKSAMFWDSRSRIERIKSLVLSNLGLQQFDDVQDFRIDELTSISQLSLSKNKIIHLQPISILDTLVTLNINYNKVYNLSPLESLVNLQQFYASNNLIVNIDSLKALQKLRILNVYKNKIGNFQSTFSTLQKLVNLEDLDVEENPFYSEDVKSELVCLPISRLNDQLIPKAEKRSEMESNPSIVNMSSSCVINSLNVSMMRDTKTSFFNPSSKSIKRNKIKELAEQFDRMQDEYSKIDDEFEEEIVKNVQLKTEYHRLAQKIKEDEQLKEDNQYKEQQIKLLKRKAKALKENLFTKDKKGDLLRKLFQLQTEGISRKTEQKVVKKQIVWARKFDSDDVIFIEDDNKYLQEDAELAALLQSNSSVLQQLRKQLRELS